MQSTKPLLLPFRYADSQNCKTFQVNQQQQWNINIYSSVVRILSQRMQKSRSKMRVKIYTIESLISVCMKEEEEAKKKRKKIFAWMIFSKAKVNVILLNVIYRPNINPNRFTLTGTLKLNWIEFIFAAAVC